MKTKVDPDALPVRLIACVLAAACLLLGVVGLLLPVIPGLLFLLIAALIGARYFPSLERRLRRAPAVGAYLDRADSFRGLTPWEKLQVGGLICAKIVLDGMALVGSLAMKLLRSGTGKQYERQ
jgi:uncharacterized membrane protein YbaN (DUF454 family)